VALRDLAMSISFQALLAAPAAALASAAASAAPISAAPADQAAPDDDSASAANPKKSAAQTGKEPVIIRAKPWLFNRETRYAHSLPEVDGTTITVTKKTSVVKLDHQPPVIDNNQREVFDRLPGIVLAEQQNPTQLNQHSRLFCRERSCRLAVRHAVPGGSQSDTDPR